MSIADTAKCSRARDCNKRGPTNESCNVYTAVPLARTVGDGV